MSEPDLTSKAIHLNGKTMVLGSYLYLATGYFFYRVVGAMVTKF